MKVLVFGGTHFVGRHTVEVLLANGYEVAVLNRGVSPDALPPEVERIRADRSQHEAVKTALHGRSFDAVVDCIGYRKDEIETAIGLFAGRVERYVYISSVSVYQPAALYPVLETSPVHVRSGWSYAQQKVECEGALLGAVRDSGFPAVIFRPGYIYGRYNNNPNWEMKMFARIEEGRPVIIPGDGNFIFHHGTAYDLARATLSALRQPKCVGNAYNITGPQAATANEYVRVCVETVGREVEIVRGGPSDRRTAEQYFPFQTRPTQIYSIEKARRDLDWEPELPLLAGHRDAYRWYRETGFAEAHPFDFAAEEEVLARLRA